MTMWVTNTLDDKMEKLQSLNQKVDAVEAEFLKLPQVSCPVVHSFGPGVYMRQVTIPADSFAIGHHQNFPQMNVMVKGKVSMKNSDGSFTTLSAPQVFVGKPGRKIGYVHEDMVWINVYATNETDVEKLEAHYLTKSIAWNDSETVKALKQIKCSVDSEDFKQVVAMLGYTEEQVRQVSVNDTDMTELPHGSYKIKVANSGIEGKGLFATSDIIAGEIIAPARISGKRTIAGRYTNHSKSPNAEMIALENGDINLVATKEIIGCHGGLDGEEITIDYKKTHALTLKISQGVQKCQV